MPNRNSSAGHVPERTCVICRSKRYKSELIRFVFFGKNVVIDIKQHLNKRGYYVCSQNECLQKLDKWFKKKRKKGS